MDTLHIIIPAYNEEANIETVAREWHEIVETVGGDSRLVIINDGSKDNTLTMLQELALENGGRDNVTVLIVRVSERPGLWQRLMGKTVYATGEEIREGAHVFAHSRKDGKEGVCYLVINNASDVTSVELPKDATVYTLTGKDGLRSRVMQLNGRDLVLGENDALPCLCGAEVKAGTIELPAESCSFIVL